MKKIILFDGVCLFCQKSVQFIIARDAHRVFQFASLQSPVGKKLLKEHHVPPNEDSLILLDQGRYYSKSTAALLIAKSLTGFWKWCYVFIIVPKPIRDLIYQLIAKNRYKLFRHNASCPIPSKEMRKRFLD